MKDYDLNKTIKLTHYQLIQLTLICLSLGAGITLIQSLLGFIVIGVSLIFLIYPIIQKIRESDKD